MKIYRRLANSKSYERECERRIFNRNFILPAVGAVYDRAQFQILEIVRGPTAPTVELLRESGDVLGQRAMNHRDGPVRAGLFQREAGGAGDVLRCILKCFGQREVE